MDGRESQLEVRPQLASAPLATACLDTLIRSQRPFIRHRLRTLFPSYLDWDELEQQVLMSLVRSSRSYRGTGSIRAWVDCITVRVGMKHARRVRMRERRDQAMGRCLRGTSFALAADDYANRCELQRLFAAISEPQQRALILRYGFGLKISEIAAQMGVPPDTARSRVRHGMKRLRRKARARTPSQRSPD